MMMMKAKLKMSRREDSVWTIRIAQNAMQLTFRRYSVGKEFPAALCSAVELGRT